MGDREAEAQTLNTIGYLRNDLGNPKEALSFYERALTLRHELADRSAESETLHNIAAVYSLIGDKSKALEIYQQAFELRLKLREFENCGKSSSTIQAIEVNGESFALATKPAMPVIVKPGESFRFSVVFDPGSDRSFKGKVRVRSLVSGKDGVRTLDIGLAGRGVPSPAVNMPASPKVTAVAR